MKKKYQIICDKCGFVTLSYQDMVEHLAQIQELKEENCKKKIITIKLA